MNILSGDGPVVMFSSEIGKPSTGALAASQKVSPTLPLHEFKKITESKNLYWLNIIPSVPFLLIPLSKELKR